MEANLIVKIATYVFCLLSIFVIGFQIALVMGAPWGELTLGGKWRGRLPSSARLFPLLSIAILVFFVALVLARSGLAVANLSEFSAKGIWIVVAYCALGVVVNGASPSIRERRLWVPVLILMLVTSALVATAAR